MTQPWQWMSSAMPTIGIPRVACCTARMAGSPNVTTTSMLCYKFARECGHSLDAHVDPNEIVADVMPLYPTCRLHVTSERPGEWLTVPWIDTQNADRRHYSLLRARRQRQFPPSDGDCHTPLPCEARKGTIPH
jgi:hypothetical protein